MADNLQQWHGGLVDPTLTKATVAAEAKATGVAIEAVKKTLKELQDTGVSSEYIEEAIREYLTNNPIEGVTNRELEKAVEAALQEAKDSGEFKGDPGDPGPAGKDGNDGNDGERGEKGTTFTPSVSEDGTLSWTNDGGLANPDPVNIKGPAGDNGGGEGGAQYINELLPDPNEESVEEDNVVLPVKADDSDKLGGKNASEYLTADKVVNNFTTTREGFVADARALKDLNDEMSTIETITLTPTANVGTDTGSTALRFGKILVISCNIQVDTTNMVMYESSVLFTFPCKVKAAQIWVTSRGGKAEVIGVGNNSISMNYQTAMSNDNDKRLGFQLVCLIDE